MAVHLALKVKKSKRKKKYAAQVDDGSRAEFGRNHIKPGKDKPRSEVSDQLTKQRQ